MNLGYWQRVSRIFPNRPFGIANLGDATISADPNTRTTITGTINTNSATLGSTAFNLGDLVLIHQTQGSGAGNWEINQIGGGGGTTSVTFKVDLKYTYGTGAQIIKVGMYNNLTVNSHSVTGWNGSTGGVEVLIAKKVTIPQTLTLSSLGFRGGNAITNASDGVNGDGTAGNRSQGTSQSAYGNAGIMGNKFDGNNSESASGGGHANAPLS